MVLPRRVKEYLSPELFIFEKVRDNNMTAIKDFSGYMRFPYDRKTRKEVYEKAVKEFENYK